ncbi:MAG: phosphoenolpyruvate carboxylase [Gammaproteobacteria bacterium]
MPQESDSAVSLRRDIKYLGTRLGDVLRSQEGDSLFEIAERIRHLSKETKKGDKQSGDTLMKLLQSLDGMTLLKVVRAFNQFLNLANLAENIHRIRRVRWYERQAEFVPQPGSIQASVRLLKTKGLSNEKIVQAMQSLDIDLVLTAHPTEVIRRTLIQKYDRISKTLLALDRADLTPREVQQNKALLDSEITAAWHTDEIRSRKPTPLDEVKWGLAVIEGTLWDAIPAFLREMDEAFQALNHTELPLDARPIHFSAWMGGDRDGNPNVTSDVTEKACLLSRWMAADLYWRDLNALIGSISLRIASKALREIVGDDPEPYRALLRPIRNQLAETRKYLEERYEGRPYSPENILISKEQLLRPLQLCYESLVDSGAKVVAEGALLDTIRRVMCFGIEMVRLDVRQDAKCHTQLLSELTQFLGIGDYATWTESDKQIFLLSEINSKRPLIARDVKLSPQSEEVWQTFRVLSQQLPESLGAYVISMASQPSDILAIVLLQKEAHFITPMRVVPLFETLKDLEHAKECMTQLFSLPDYLRFSMGYQEVMIGYSDSSKDAGILAASWALYRTQAALVKVAEKFNVKLTLFHGRGGTVGRGGAPAHIAILSQPPGSVQGRLRVTEQGEVIRNKYGILQRAVRAFSLYTTAVMQAMLLPPPAPKPAWCKVMDELADVACHAYRTTLNSKDFYPYFEAVTPLKEIDRIAIGSRPSKRQGTSGFQSLRAIPWVFAWTQNRLLLPAWLGVGEGLAFLSSKYPKELKQMMSAWPFFKSTFSLIEMVLAKADIDVFTLYEIALVPVASQHFGRKLRHDFYETMTRLEAILGRDSLLKSNRTLHRSIQVRNPYVYTLNLLQIELLSRVRRATIPNQDETQALLVSIAGIAAGMRNTG